MTHFPRPISLPEQVTQARTERSRQVVRSARQGILIRASIIIFELIGVFYFESSSLLMDAISSFVDVLFSLFLILCIKFAEKPPDKNHPFGHGRFEPLMGLQLSLLLALIGGGMLAQQSFHLVKHHEDVIISAYAWMVPFFALILLEICYQFVIRTAKKYDCPALAADAIHYRIDGITSFFATLALLFAVYFPFWGGVFDHFGAIIIALLMIGMGFYAARSNFHQLLDRAPSGHYFKQVREAALKVDGVHETEKIRIQLYGPDAHVDIDIEVDPYLSVEIAHQMTQKVRAEIQKAWPAVRDVTVHVEPYYPNDH